MGKDKRPGIIQDTKVPGPGNYPIKTTVGDARKTVLASKISPLKPIVNVPGPGAYDPKHSVIVASMPSSGIGYGNRGIRTGKRTVIVPGPGAYTTADEKVHGPMYGFGSDTRKHPKNPYPGPADYKIPMTFAAHPAYVKKTLNKVVE